MNNYNSLFSIALLSTYLEKQRRDYIDIISDFVLYCLPRSINSQINIQEVQQQVSKRFGLEKIPNKLIESILIRHSKNTNSKPIYIERREAHFFVKQLYDNDSFDAETTSVREKIDEVLSRIRQYFNDKFFQNISKDKCRELLLSFFDSYGLSFINDTNNLRGITSNEGKYNFWLAQLIISEHSSQTLFFSYLTDIVKGILVYRSIYLYPQDPQNTFDMKLRNVTFYLDCSLVLDCMAYDSEEDEIAVDQLINLIRQSGGKICVLEHTVEEAEHTLLAFAAQPDKANSFHLERLENKGYPTDVLYSIASSVSSRIKECKGLAVCADPSYSNTRNHYFVLDEERIIAWLTDKRNNKVSTERFSYDAKSLSAISILRKGTHPTKIESCFAILITQDPWLNRCLRDMDMGKKRYEVDYTILDIDLVSYLWLKNYNSRSSVPEDLLIASSMAACKPSQDIVNKAIELADSMARDQLIDKTEALIIRSQPIIRNYIFEETNNDISSLTSDTIRFIINKYIKSQFDAKGDRSLINPIVYEESAKEPEVTNDHIKHQNKTDSDESRAKDSLISELKEQIVILKEALAVRNKNLVDKYTKAEKMATIKSKHFNFVLKLFSIIMLSVVLIGSVYSLLINIPITKSSECNIVLSILFVILPILSVLQLLDFIFKWMGPLQKFITRLTSRVYTNIYNKMLDGKIDK